jgi:hypothetical protein
VGDCSITLDALYRDSAYVRSQTVDQLLDLENEAVRAGLDDVGICAVMGPVDAQAHMGLSVVTEHWELPQIGYATMAHQLSNRDRYLNFIRTLPDGQDFAVTLAYAAQRDIWFRDYVAVIYEPDYGEQFEDPLEDVEDEVGYETITEGFSIGSDESLREALSDVAPGGDGYHTIMLTIDHFAVLDDVARIAVELGIVGEGYLWMITGDALPDIMRKRLSLEPGSPLDMLLDGAYTFTNYDPYYYKPEGDRFLQTWKNQAPSYLRDVLARQPPKVGENDNGSPFVADLAADYFATTTPANFASFLYDSIIAMGVSVCAAQAAGDDHDNALLASRFTGASGPFAFQEDDDGELMPTRDPQYAVYGMHNIRSVDNGDGMRTYDSVMVATYDSQKAVWEKTGEDFYYTGGTSEEPMPLITPDSFNYLSKTAQIVGFCLVGVSLFICIGSAIWVYLHRQNRTVKASQPEFLLLLCLGAALVSVSLIFMSFDEDKGWSEAQLSRSCATFPWLFVLGYAVMYCALVCKLWRLSRLLQMRRRAVAAKQVLLPFVVVTACLLIVLTVWTIHDPLQWVREQVGDNPRNTYGKCQVQDEALPYIIPLGGLLLLAMGATAVLCWQLKDVQADLVESRWIFFGIFGHLQVWAIGIPLFIIADDISRDVSYMMTAALCFVFSTTLVACVIWPKMYVCFVAAYCKDDGKRKITVNVTGEPSARISGMNSGMNFQRTGSFDHSGEAVPEAASPFQRGGRKPSNGSSASALTTSTASQLQSSQTHSTHSNTDSSRVLTAEVAVAPAVSAPAISTVPETPAEKVAEADDVKFDPEIAMANDAAPAETVDSV